MDKYLDNLCDELDASVFSGDKLHNEINLEAFKKYLARWGREAERIERMLEEGNYE